MNSKKYFVIALVLTTVFLFNCDQQPTTPENIRSYSFLIQTGSSLIQGAIVSIQTKQQNYSATTNNKGKCEISITNTVSLPDFLIATIDHSSIMPHAITVPGAKNSNSNRSINCESIPSRVLVREVELHHLGNDLYGGPENSQLQIPTEGIQLSYSFYLSSIPNSMPYIRIFARGVQCRTEVKINGITTDYMGDSAANGDLSLYKFQLTANPATVFKTGTNNLTIRTGAYNEQDPWDDIEFCSLLLYYP